MTLNTKLSDISVYVLLDPEHAGGHRLPDLAAAAAQNGASILQIRDKLNSARDMIALTKDCLEAVSGTGVPIVVNDRVDVAIAAGANGVHVGQTDIPVTIARRMLGPDALVGLTVKTATHLEQAPLEDISYFGMGGVFATSTKNNPSAPIGLDGVSELVRVARGRGYAGPLAAIAGIDKGNAGDVIRAGADGICVVSAVSRAADPGQAVAGLAQVVARARPER